MGSNVIKGLVYNGTIYKKYVQAEEREEDLGSLRRKATHLCKSANSILAAGNKDEVDDFYELISLADRLSSVSKQLQGKYKSFQLVILPGVPVAFSVKSLKATDDNWYNSLV